MRHGNAAASITPEEWVETYRPALYRQLARSRRVLMDPATPNPDERLALLELLAVLEQFLGSAEPVNGSADDRVRHKMLNQQARLMRYGS